MNSNRKLGWELQLLLKESDYICKVSHWAYLLHTYKSEPELSDEIKNIVNYLSAMDDDPQFEYSKEQLEFLARKLIMEEEHPFEQMQEAKSLAPPVITRSLLGNELKKQLESGSEYDPEKIAYWAEGMLLCYGESMPKEFIDILEVLTWMPQRPEFVFSKEQLEFLADRLIENDPKALEKI